MLGLRCKFSFKEGVDKLNSSSSMFVKQISDKVVESRLRKLLQKERLYPVDGNYIVNMQQGTNMQQTWRSKIASWLFGFEVEFTVERETILLALNIMDRFLSLKHVSQEKLQLLAIACILISTKIRESKPFRILNLADLAEGMYSCDEIILMEKEVLVVLKWRLNCPTSLEFLDLFTVSLRISVDQEALGFATKTCLSWQKIENILKRLLFCTHFAFEFVQFLPSELSLCSICAMFSLFSIDFVPWQNAVFSKFRIDLSSRRLMICTNMILQLFSRSSRHLASISIFQESAELENVFEDEANPDSDNEKENVPPSFDICQR